MLKRRSKKLFKIKIFYLLAFYIYKLFISIYFFNHKFQLKKYLKDTKVIFFSSFISIEDFKKISLSLNDDCIKIQNHAGSIKTLENFSNAQNNKTSSDCNPYLDYLNLQDKIIFQSNLQKQEINNKFPFLKDKTFSFLPSVNEGDLLNAKLIDSPFFNKDVFNIVYVATIQERKRQKLCLKIIEKILNKDFDVNLYFVGSYNKHDNYFTDLEKTVCDMKLQNHVFFTGYTENFANYMWHSDLILHPSSAEGVPRVLREASFIGKTII